jgi:hypothetical protein
VREFWRALKEPWEYFTIEMENARAEGEPLVAAVRFEAVGKGSGIPVDLRFAHVWTVEADLIVGYAAYSSLEEALEAAGLGE